MTDAEWEVAAADLSLAFPNREQSEEQAATRANLYRRHLDDLTEAQWTHAVRQAILHERWYPTVAQLREYAAEWTPTPAGYLPPAWRTEEEAALDREAARRGLELVRAAVAARARELATPAPRSLPVFTMPSAPPPIYIDRHAARVALLRQQAAEIVAADETTASV